MTGPILTIIVSLVLSAPGLAGRNPAETAAGTGRPGSATGSTPEGVHCKGQPQGTSCWMELANQPGCYVWNSYFQEDEALTWTAGCAGGLAHGKGTLTEVWDGGKKKEEDAGRSGKGEALGRWVYRDQDGNVSEGPFEEGMRHGDWVERLAGGTVQEGPYEAGKRQGKWSLRFATGTVMEGSFAKG
ncbi:MAG: hypothetical protein OXH11_19975 [Candidatus Aminicenantes bacterium]|nr:hypothetical protein [Candidatus Aminicenantes bacterium]